ncbi:SusC/RagA family TonB-linked outer membrane protein [Aquimarina sp. TRL1]|uniref:SusC/RagA family TonB-linked outer membrane protein n=1 Tax=Aquimarina sp. (strain TRL1) TaxID=2736252 RepID=UPI00158B100F|nr:SusC/RagA family TonB-linked outer membrane protein [Aquimarina sp. TRL1]QKX03752.1 SusC/RagA family TonB-linked outer membrane protein [Aquimarina sp. TRL1]
MKQTSKQILMLFTVLIVQLTFAQEKTVTGIVTDQSGVPLPGVNILIQGTNSGTQTDFDGKYSINTNKGATLLFRYIGFANETILISEQSTINVSLREDAAVLEEVVVTAQGIQRERKSLGYSVSTVQSEEIQQQSQADLGRILQGKAAGINITATNGVSGSGTNFIIRGYNSISGSNQPLFIVDGVPFDGGANEQTAFFDGVTESSRFLDLDPNSITDVKVLKGLSATVLYGERGSNGVVLITTKGGSSKATNKKLEVTVTSSYYVNEAILPKFQKDYGGGFHQGFGFFFSNWGPNFNNQNPAPYGSSFRGIASDGTVLVEHPLGRLADESLKADFLDIVDTNYRYKNYNSVKNFFRSGGVSDNSINLRGGNEKATYNVGLSKLEDKGFTPGNKLSRINLSVGGNAELSNNIKVGGTINYSNTAYKTPPIAASTGSGTIGDGSSVFGDVLYTPRSVDLLGLPFQTSDGRSVYYRSGNDIQNPLWTVHNAKTTQDTERIFGNFRFNYKLNDNLALAYQLGLDTYTEFGSYGQNKGGVDGNQTGIYRTTQSKNKIWNHNLTLNYNKDLNEDLNLQFIVGGQSRRDVFQRDGVESTQQLAFGVLEHYNFVNHTTVNSFSNNPIAFLSEENQVGLYADATLGYKGALFLNFAARNDWTSTLETDNFSIFYPAASISFVPTDFFDSISNNDILSYLKLRLGYGTSAGFPAPYGTRNTLALTSRAFVDREGNVISGNSVSNRLGNPNLKPETISEIEAGMDAQFFNNKFSLNVSVYKKESKDLITDQSLDPASGFTVTRVNAGSLENKGIEVDFNIKALRLENFEWTLGGNFFADQNEITKLPEGTDQIALTSSIAGRAANYAIVGQPYGILQGTAIQRDANGNKIVDANGEYLATNDIQILGDPNPDWTMGITNTFKFFKNFTLYTNILYRHGGDIASQTASTLLGRGTVGFPIDRTATYILPGVKQDGSPNDIQVTATTIGFNTIGFGPNELQIYDGTTIRLNEVSLSYDMPNQYLKKTPFGNLSITLRGNNLWYKAVNFPDDVRFDTNALSTGVGNGQGIDFITGPSARRYGISVRATF